MGLSFNKFPALVTRLRDYIGTESALRLFSISCEEICRTRLADATRPHLSQRRFLHLANHFAQVSHCRDQAGLLGIHAPIAGDDKRLKIILYAMSFVGFSFVDIEGHIDVPADDIAVRVNGQSCEYIEIETLHRTSVVEMHNAVEDFGSPCGSPAKVPLLLPSPCVADFGLSGPPRAECNA
jgi:hypothetical protein